ncbi:MAG: hypothetical protein JXQ80_09180 [Bacteroidales bacterium]|nr:hypothetical protein [Bacteroidales bacterium]
MKNLSYLLLLSVLLYACKHDSGSAKKVEAVPTIKVSADAVMKAAKDYLQQSVSNPIVSEIEGLLRVQGVGETYILESGAVLTGRIDDDNREDAIATCRYEKTGEEVTKTHLILLNKDSLQVVTAVTLDMEMMSIANGTIQVLRSTLPPDDPGIVPCPVCVDTLYFRLENGEFVEI